MNKLLIATNYRLIFWDGQAHVIHESEDLHDAHYYGTTWNLHGTIFVAGEVGGEWRIRTFDRHFQERHIMMGSAILGELHQALWWGNRLTVCSAGTNCLAHLMGGVWFRTWWQYYGQDHDHINSIWCDGEHYYVVEFRQKEDPPEPSVVRVLDLDFHYQFSLEIGPPIHNVYVENRRLHTLVGGEKAGVLMIDMRQGGQTLAPLGQRTFLRGYARTQERVYIGNMLWEHEREKRVAYRGDSQILVLDTDYNQVDEIIVPNCGAVAEVRVLDEPDLAHHGQPLMA